MPVTVAPAALPAPKKNADYKVVLTASGGTSPYSWSVSSGALPTGFTLARINETQAVVSGKTPGTLNASTFTATITATDAVSATGTCVSTTIALVVDGPDSQGYHGTEANRTTVTLVDAVDHGAGFPVADALARAWPSSAPAQNS